MILKYPTLKQTKGGLGSTKHEIKLGVFETVKHGLIF
jgi:hypothetical protein